MVAGGTETVARDVTAALLTVGRGNFTGNCVKTMFQSESFGSWHIKQAG